MAAGGRIVEAVVVIDEVGVERRHVGGHDEIDAIALQAVDDGFAGELGGNRGLSRDAQLFTGRPQQAAARCAVELALCVITIADGNTAIAVGHLHRKADRILIGHRLPSGSAGFLRSHRRIAQHATDAFLCQHVEVKGPSGQSALAEQHAGPIIEGDLGNFGRACGWRHRDLKTRIVAKRTVRGDRHRPDL
jgi:hypothetical protein